MTARQMIFSSAVAEEILGLWLDEVGPDRWYEQDPSLDRQIRTRFEPLWRAAAADRLTLRCLSPEAQLALIILLDQFPRNMFRGEARAFQTDPMARQATNRAIAGDIDLAIPEPERQFFYLPLMHSEILADQERCIRLLMLRMPEAGAENVKFGIMHRAVIRRFGRFPSRNAALGRAFTEAERAYRDARGYMSGA